MKVENLAGVAPFLIDPAAIGDLPLRACREVARQRRLAGYYDQTTLACFRQALRRGGNAGDLVAYLSFRRDMGEVLHPRYVPLLRPLMPRLGPRGWLESFNLLAEATGEVQRMAFHLRPVGKHLRELSPPLMASLAHQGRSQLTPFSSGQIALMEAQDERRVEFAQAIKGTEQLCVVGNHAGLSGMGLGHAIDDHDCVVRFNQFVSPHSRVKDIGVKTDVWVRAPGFTPHDIVFNGRWVVLSGPDLRYRLTNWQVVRPLLEQGKPLLTVPLEIWRDLVGYLAAPPSAGLLLLAWIRRLRHHGLRGVSIAGFQRGDGDEGRYHHALPDHPPGQRHNWKRERALLAEWVWVDGALWLVKG